MSGLLSFASGVVNLLDRVKRADFIVFLLLRVFLAPVMIMAGLNKFNGFENTVAWFGNPEWGLGLPMPALMAGLAASAELFGGIALLIGLFTRLATIPLMFTMLVAAATAHWSNGWHTLPEDRLTAPWEWRKDLIDEAIQKREKARDLLRQHGNYSWLTSAGPITVLKNGIELSAIYFLMLLTLFFTGPGRFVSVDYWLKRFVLNRAD
jgi:putative oxidoreductase